MALRTSTQVMSAIRSVLGSGAVRGLVAIVSAKAPDASATSASLNTVRLREGEVRSASDMTALQPAQSRRSAIVGPHAFEGVNPRLAPPIAPPRYGTASATSPPWRRAAPPRPADRPC